MEDAPRDPDDFLILDDLVDQLDRTRSLLLGRSEVAVEEALAAIGGQSEVETRIAAALAATAPLAQPERFAEAHRLTMRALEVLDREGSRDPRVPHLGPLTPLAEKAVEYVAEYITSAFARSVVETLRRLYTRREAQCPPERPERRLLARARQDAERLAPGFGGGALPTLLIGGAAVPAAGWLSQYVGALDIGSQRVRVVGLVLGFLVFFVLSWVLLQGAAVAHRRSRLIMQRPLAALWETIGHCGQPLRDQSRTFATAAIILTALLWFVLPAAAALLFLL